MSRFATRLGFLCSAWLVAGMAFSDDARPVREAPDLKATQVTLGIEKGKRHRLFQATVLAIEDDVLTVLTAASLVDGKVEGHPARILVEGELIEGTVVSVARNPAHVPGPPQVLPRVTADRVPLPRATSPTTFYNNTRLRSIAQPMRTVNRQQLAATTASEIPGANNAIVRFRFPAPPGLEPNNAVVPAFRNIRPATALASSTFPGASGGSVTARIVGGDGREHEVLACNFRNPLLLEWGHRFDPVPDDSGSGVFVLRQAADGRLEPVLIGVLIGPDDRGGLASLVARKMPWVEEALAAKTSAPASPEGSQSSPAPAGR